MKSVYILWHIREMEDQEDEKLIGVYASESDAKDATERFKTKPGFKNFPGGFHIEEYEIGKDHWSEGFVTDFTK